MHSTLPNPNPPEQKHRRTVLILLTIGIFLLFFLMFSQAAFNITFLRPNTNQQTFIFAALSAVIFLLLVALSFVLIRTLLKLYAERSIDKWFSRPVEEVREHTAKVAALLSSYAAQNARAEAASIAASPEAERAFSSGNFALVIEQFRRHEATLQGGFALALLDDNMEAGYHAPAPWPLLRSKLPLRTADSRNNGPQNARPIQLEGREFMVGSARVGDHGRILVALPLPANFSATVNQLDESQRRYAELSAQRKVVRRTYMGLLLLLTVLVLFAATWFALFLSKLVTRPVAALAEATQEISRGNLNYRVEVPAADELGSLVQSFNRMAAELESSRKQIENSTCEVAEANLALNQRRGHMETILESIPTGVLSLDASRRVTHTNSALTRIFAPRSEMGSAAQKFSAGTLLSDLFPAEVAQELERMLRKADRMGTTSSQVEMNLDRAQLNAAVTIASLKHDGERLGYVIVFEDLSDLLKAQKQAAWREVARRVAHEIKNPLTPIALSAERIRRHLERGTSPDGTSVAVIHNSVDTISGAVETLRTLVDEFSTLARFPAAQPQPASINSIIENALAMFDGRLDNIQVRKFLASDLPNVMADPEALKRAFANLVDNAAEALQGSLLREVHISTAMVGNRDAVEIIVADTGLGITGDLREKLFLPYFSTKKRGTGLGLAIVARIVEDHHGSIRVEENTPVGARFIVELPVAPQSASRTAGNNA